MTSAGRGPLVTLAVVAYNQRQFIREAVEGAFAQTYGPLEVLLSDDCSTDETFEIMRGMADSYSGRATVVLNRNEPNLGMLGHINRVNELAKGELVVAAAGDDVSVPDRVQRTVALWQEGGCRADLLVFDVTPIGRPRPDYTVSAADQSLESQVENAGCRFKGAAAAWTKRLFQRWGGVPEDGLAEDKVLGFRAALSGGIACGSDAVVRYRVDPGPVIRHNSDALERWRWLLARNLVSYRMFCRDVERLRALEPAAWQARAELWRRLESRMSELETDLRLMASGRTGAVRLASRILRGTTWQRLSPRSRLLRSLSVVRHLVLAGERLGRYEVGDHRAPYREAPTT
jgi:glycosyltransferase involved in cell wall biosynthesis